MAKDPAFLFYPGDWMGGTQWMTMEQKGCYLELLILQFNTGGFTLAQAKQVLSICFDVAWPMLKHKFEIVDGLFINEKLKCEIEKRKNFTNSRRINALSPKTPQNPNSAHAEHMHKHMENENENENIKRKKKKRVQGEKTETIINTHPFQPDFYQHWERWLNYKRDEYSDRYKTLESEQTAYNRLVKLSGSDQFKAIEIIDYSIAQHWKGLFKDDQTNGKPKFNNKNAGREGLNVVAEAYRKGVRVDFRTLDEPTGS